VSTFDQLVQVVLGNLQGFSLDQDQITYLASAIDADDLSLSVGDIRELSRGLVEIDDEVLWVQSVDQSSNVATVAPHGRGWLGTTAASHAQNSVVTNNPKWPRVIVKRAINDTVTSTYPDLFQVKTTTFTFNAAKFAYELPADVDDIHSVSWDVIGPSRRWPRLSRWRFMPDANTTSFASGKAIELLDSVVPGRTVQVTYMKAPAKLTNGSDEFATVTGLPSTAEDVVIYGACYRLSGYLDIPRLQQQNVEGTNRSQLVPPGSAANASKYFYALYSERLSQEREMLLGRYPRVTHSMRI
jgi:hypothetical protein